MYIQAFYPPSSCNQESWKTILSEAEILCPSPLHSECICCMLRKREHHFQVSLYDQFNHALTHGTGTFPRVLTHYEYSLVYVNSTYFFSSPTDATCISYLVNICPEVLERHLLTVNDKHGPVAIGYMGWRIVCEKDNTRIKFTNQRETC
jgi:hypothetical protein